MILRNHAGLRDVSHAGKESENQQESRHCAVVFILQYCIGNYRRDVVIYAIHMSKFSNAFYNSVFPSLGFGSCFDDFCLSKQIIIRKILSIKQCECSQLGFLQTTSTVFRGCSRVSLFRNDSLSRCWISFEDPFEDYLHKRITAQK